MIYSIFAVSTLYQWFPSFARGSQGKENSENVDRKGKREKGKRRKGRKKCTPFDASARLQSRWHRAKDESICCVGDEDK